MQSFNWIFDQSMSISLSLKYKEVKTYVWMFKLMKFDQDAMVDSRLRTAENEGGGGHWSKDVFSETQK